MISAEKTLLIAHLQATIAEQVKVIHKLRGKKRELAARCPDCMQEHTVVLDPLHPAVLFRRAQKRAAYDRATKRQQLFYSTRVQQQASINARFK